MNIFTRVDTLATCNESLYFSALRPTLKTGNEIFYLSFYRFSNIIFLLLSKMINLPINLVFFEAVIKYYIKVFDKYWLANSATINFNKVLAVANVLRS